MGADVNGGKGIPLPHNLEAERVLLGAILLDNAAFEPVGDYLEPTHFHDPFNQKLFDTMRLAIRAGALVAIDTIKPKLNMLGSEPVADTTLDFYLHKIYGEACGPSSAADYAKQIRDLSIRRDLIRIADEIKQNAFKAAADANPRIQIEGIEQQLFSLAESNIQQSGFIPFSETLARTVQAASDAYKRGGALSGIPTGLDDLDHKLGGLTGTDFIIIAGRPGMGKTALATNIAYHVARTWTGKANPDGSTVTLTGGRVGFFSLEMSAEQLGTRVVADQANLNSSKIRRGQFSEAEFKRIKEVERERNTIPLHIDDTGGLNLAQICTRARRMKRQHGLDLIVIDYLQLISGAGKKNENRVNELTAITSGLKALAKELHVPIIGLSQLSRAVENRDDKRPQLSDLRESGSIEQDADVVLFVFREAYYLEIKEPQDGTEEKLKWNDQMALVKNKADIIIAKQRHGSTGNVPVHFDGDMTRFSNLVNADRLPAAGRPGEPRAPDYGAYNPDDRMDDDHPF